MKCSNCGSAIPKNSAQCPTCGKTVPKLYRMNKRIAAAVIIAVIIGTAIGTVLYRTVRPDNTTAATVFDIDAALPSASPGQITAYGAVIEEYRAVLSLSEMEWQSNSESYIENYPMINPAYVGFFHMGMVDTLYAACHDIDGNGTAELFIGIGDSYSPMEAGVYAFNGSEAVILSLADTSDGYQILTDGTFIRSDKGGTVLTVKRIAPDGFSLEDAEISDIQPGLSLQDVDLSARGDHLTLDTWGTVLLS